MKFKTRRRLICILVLLMMLAALVPVPAASPQSGLPGQINVKTPPGGFKSPPLPDSETTMIIIKLFIGKTGYEVNGEAKEMDAAPIIREERTLLPIRYVVEALGGTVGWTASERKVTVTLNEKVIELWIEKNIARVNGQEKFIDTQNQQVAPIIIPPGRTMLPLRFIAENLGCKVDWDAAAKKVTVTYFTTGSPGGTPGSQGFSNATALIGQVQTPLSSEKEKFMQVNLTNRLTHPKYDTSLDLFAATGPGKPGQQPVSFFQQVVLPDVNGAQSTDAVGPLKNTNPHMQANLALLNQPGIKPGLSPIKPFPASTGPVYSNADCAAFIDQSGDKKRWFAFKLNSDIQAVKVVWQVSTSPFSGFRENWQKPSGLVSSGEVSPQAGEFVIDFGSFAPGQQTGGLWNLKVKNWMIWNHSSYREIPKTQRKYYVRAAPVDANGNCIGDPGEGLQVLYGKALTAPTASTQGKTVSFELWAARWTGEPSYQPVEFPNTMEHKQLFGYSPDETQPHWFMFQGFDPAATKMVMQVSAKPFTGSAADWEAPPGLVYAKSYSPLPVSLTGYGNNIVPVPFKDFGPPKTALKPDEYLPFYVRAVAVKPSSTPGCVDVDFSETITVKYGYASPPKIYIPQNVTVPSYIPNIKVLHYQPVQWENPDWPHHYMVFQAPKWNEISCKWKNLNNGATLYPYSPFTYSGISPQQYEQQVIPTVLVPGTKALIRDREEDKSWWGELWDGICSFFSSIVDVIAKLTNWVSQTYANLKAGLINFVANAFPVESWRDALKVALTAMVDTGLAAMGIPPTLPNFDQLSNMSLDYMAEVALTEAGVPANQLTEELVKKTAAGLEGEMAKAAGTATPNPINSPFLKADPDYLSRPAYIDVELSNPYDKPSLPGSLNIDAQWEWRETGVTVTTETWAHLPTDQQYAEGLKYAVHFFYGLSQGHEGYPIYYRIYEPVRGQPIPSLQPGETRVVRIYLKEYVGKPYFAGGESVNSVDFANLYWGNCGKAIFSVSTGDYDLPDPKAAAKAAGFQEDSDHLYTYHYDCFGHSKSDGFQQAPCQPFSP